MVFDGLIAKIFSSLSYDDDDDDDDVMSMRPDYISEPRLPTGLLFIPQARLESHGRMMPKTTDSSIRISGNSTSRVI
jgi:hypothetical protein